tara:strand:- start:1249 stop:2178 length:930 start_codon:yes stop_codon:yes gene_type:complete
MAIRSPLYYVSGDLKEMSTTMVDEIISQTIYQYASDPSVVLSVVASGGNVGSITDTRQQAGAMSSGASSFPSEATTAEPSTVTVTYDKIQSTATSGSAPSDSGKTWPVYKTAGNDIQAMTLQDVKDTFIHPAIDKLVAATTTTEQGGTYHISSSSSVTGSTLVSATPIFLNTQADTAAYAAANIPETLDQPTTITSYYLHRINGVDNTLSYNPLFITGGNDLQEYTEGNFETLLADAIKYTAAASVDGYKITYSYTTGTNRGTGMTDTILTGSGDYQTHQAGADDYRAQEFPNGSPTTANTWYLKINKS